MCGIQTYQDGCLIPPGLDSRADDYEVVFKHCVNMNRCWDRWSHDCPDAKLAEPYEWLRCSEYCDGYEYCDDPDAIEDELEDEEDYE